MKRVIWVSVLLVIPLMSQAGWKSHRKDNHFHGHEQHYSKFWDDIARRQHRQSARIERSVKKGLLSHRELKKLHREQKHIAKQIRHLKRHNYISQVDKSNMVEHLDYLSMRISKLNRNDQYAYSKRVSEYNHTDYVDYRRRDTRVITRSYDNYSGGLYFRF